MTISYALFCELDALPEIDLCHKMSYPSLGKILSVLGVNLYGFAFGSVGS